MTPIGDLPLRVANVPPPGKTAQEAYTTDIAHTNIQDTPDDINNGIVNIIVGFAPLKPAEFVVITLQQIAGQTGGA